MSKSVVIIGGGAVGLSVAYYAMKKGHRVTVLERGAPDRDACSFGNAGMIAPSHLVPLAAPGMPALGLRMMANRESPFSFRFRLDPDLWEWAFLFMRSSNEKHVARSAPVFRDLHLMSRRLFQEMSRDLDDFGYNERGILHLCRTEKGLRAEEKAAELARSLGIPAESLSSEERARLETGVRLTVTGGIYYPWDGHLTPARWIAALERALKEGGAEILWSKEAAGFRVESGRILAVHAREGMIEGDAFVLAAGAKSGRLAKSLGIRMPMAGGRGYNLTLDAPPASLPTPALLTEARVAVTPMGSSLRFAGTMEILNESAPISLLKIRGLVRSVSGYLPDFPETAFRGVRPWNGLRPLSPDGLPYVGPFSRYPNLFAATGHAMMGVSLGPVTGKLVAEMLSEETPEIEVSGLNPERFV